MMSKTNHRFFRAFWTAAAVVGAMAFAQAAELPTVEQIRAQMERQQEIMDQLPPAVVDADESRPVLRDDFAPQIAPQQADDLEQIVKARRWTASAAAQAPVEWRGDRIFALASFSMPEQSLARVVRDSARAGAIVVLRGLVDGSLKETARAVSELVANAKSEGWRPQIIIDPRVFREFRVESAPVFVVAPSAGPPALAAGDVSLDYALDFIVRENKASEAARAARAAIDNLRRAERSDRR